MRPCTPPIAIVKDTPRPLPVYKNAQHVVQQPTTQDEVAELRRTVQDLRLQVADLRELLHIVREDVGFLTQMIQDEWEK